MSTIRGLFFPGLVVVITTLIGVWLSTESRAQSAAPPGAIDGAWTLNKELSDKPQTHASQGDQSDAGRHSGGGGGRGMGGGHRGGGGMRGGGTGGGGTGGGGRANPDDVKRMREAMQDITTAPERLTIVRTESNMVVITTGDGRVTRLSPDGKKIKDDNTGIERKTKWDGAKLISEVSGLGPGKITETYAIDPEHGQLTVTVATDGSHDRPATSQHRVYDKSS